MAVVYVDARPGNDDQMLQTATEVGQKLRMLLLKVMTRARQRIADYFERDGLGEKLKSVLFILIQRLNNRLDNYASSMD
ncbi:unnamed protein product [Trichobilharzia regenti]|nr:unnamed protein product [Trichobilharzia regenti]